MRTFSYAICALLLASGFESAAAWADEPASFASILKADTKATFKKVADYATANPDALDANRAWKWLFITALEERMEGEAVAYAEGYLKGPKPDPLIRSLAQQTLLFGLARSGQAEPVVDLFQSQLRFARLQNGGEFVDLGLRVATALRMSRQFDASKKVLEETANKFFLDGEVRNLCENKIAKLALIDQPAPVIAASDTKGEPLELSALKGKVVLVDFWATNCGPCMEEFPNLKEIYAQHHAAGFEIIGVSLDGDAGLVEAFTNRAQLPWRMIVAEAEVDRLREKYFVRKIPSLYLINQEGKVVQYDVKGADLRDSIEALLKK